MEEQIDPRVLERFLAGDCTEAEREQVVRWVDGIPERQALLNAMRTAWTRIGTPTAPHDAKAAWNSVSARLGPAVERRGPLIRGARIEEPPLRFVRRPAPGAGWRVAALILLAVGVSAVGISSLRTHHASSGRVVMAAAREVVTPRGQRATVHLSDGSIVTLAPASRLRESPAFGVSARDVWLTGEAFFDVVHDPSKPFRVHTARAVARDLGTKFVVQAYADSREVRVVVAEGLVSLRRTSDSAAQPRALPGGGADSVVVRPREMGRLVADGRLTTRTGIALDDYTAWTDGRLVFTDAPLSDVVPRLARWYDIDLRLGDPGLARESFTASFDHEPVTEVLQLLAATVRARIAHHGDTLVLIRRRAPQ